MAKISAGLLMYGIHNGQLRVLLVHPGGPFWAKKDEGAWFVPKGELAEGEDPLPAAKREFQEETGIAPQGEFISLGSVKHKGGRKLVHAWAFEGSCNPQEIKSNTFSLEWPPRSGQMQEFPEVDRAEFFSPAQAKEKIYPSEFELVQRLEKLCVESGAVPPDQAEAEKTQPPQQGNLFD